MENTALRQAAQRRPVGFRSVLLALTLGTAAGRSLHASRGIKPALPSWTWATAGELVESASLAGIAARLAHARKT